MTARRKKVWQNFFYVYTGCGLALPVLTILVIEPGYWVGRLLVLVALAGVGMILLAGEKNRLPWIWTVTILAVAVLNVLVTFYRLIGWAERTGIPQG